MKTNFTATAFATTILPKVLGLESNGPNGFTPLIEHRVSDAREVTAD